jgi:predicted DNA-binding transcriptional regulator AlpA
MLTVHEAAGYLRLSPKSLQRLRGAGDGPRYIRLKGKVLYRESDLDRWLDARVRQSTSEQARDGVR